MNRVATTFTGLGLLAATSGLVGPRWLPEPLAQVGLALMVWAMLVVLTLAVMAVDPDTEGEPVAPAAPQPHGRN